MLGIEKALNDGCEVRVFSCSFGTRVVRIEDLRQNRALLGYGENGDVESALSDAGKEYMHKHHRSFRKQYPQGQQFAGESTDASEFDAWIYSDGQMRAVINHGVYEVYFVGFSETYERITKFGRGDSFTQAVTQALHAKPRARQEGDYPY